jgi:23S rRNA (uridine2552-2'-O)-methyltransferase
MQTLKPGGSFVCKLFQGGEEKQLIEKLRKAFTKAAYEKPEASRKDSKEIFVVAVGFKG